MAINSTHHDDGSTTGQEPRLIDLRFSLRRLMARTALADIFWANDLHGAAENLSEKNVLVLMVNPALTQLNGFSSAWQQILGRPAPAAAAYPDVIAYGEYEGEHWLALNNVNGVLLSERISELDERGLPLNTALDTLHNIQHTLDSIQAGAYGYVEPGVLQYTEQGTYKILNAPLVKVMQLLTSARKDTINQLALHSAYLSPSVSVGDVPVTEDDTFSAASLLYHLLASEPPLGASTLTAVAHGEKPQPLPKLKKQSWEAVEQALTYQRSARPENPEKFLALLKKPSRKKVLLPIAALAALGVTVFAGQHLVSRLGEYMPDTGSGSGLLLGDGKQQEEGDSALSSDQMAESAAPSVTKPVLSKQTNESAAPNTRANSNTPNNTNTSAAGNRVIRNNTAARSSQKETPPTQADSSTNNANNTQATTTARPNNTNGTTDQAQQTNNSQQASIPTPAPTPDADTTSSLLNNTDQAVDLPVAAAETDITPQSDTTDSSAIAATANNDNNRQAASTPVINNTSNSTNSAAQNNTVQQQKQEAIKQLLQQATAAFNIGQLEDSDSGKQGAISLLRELAEIDDKNPETGALVGRVVEKKYQLAERRLGAKKFEEAEVLVQDSDKLIREFMLTDKLQRQVRMESKVSILRDEQEQVNDLLREARTAISLGTLSQNDGQDHALSYLRRVLFKQPGNAEAGQLLAEIASIRQQAVYRALSTGELEQARTYLRESGRLVQKYKLQDLRADQRAIEARYEALTNRSTGGLSNTTQSGAVEVIDLTTQQAGQQQVQQQAGGAATTAARQRQLEQQAQAEAEAARQIQLQQQAQAQAEAARQIQLQQQAQAQAARQQQQAQAEAARQRQWQQQQQAIARQQQLQQQRAQAAARQRQLQQQQALARQRQLQQQAQAARQQQLQQQLQQQRAVTTNQVSNNGFTIDEDGFVIGEPPLNPEAFVNDGFSNNGAEVTIPLQGLQPYAVDTQEITPNNAAGSNQQAVPSEEMVPELQEVPLSDIQDILPGQTQQ